MRKELCIGKDVMVDTAVRRSAPDGCEECSHPIEPYLGLYSHELLENGYGLLLNIPKINLFGTQTVDEYIESKNKSVREKLSKCGIECLKKNPPLGCALIDEGRAVVALADGHHRVRNLGKMEEKPKSSPVLVLSVPELSRVLTIANPDSEACFTPEALEDSIRADITATLASFRSMPTHKQPVPIYGIKTMGDLEMKFSFR